MSVSHDYSVVGNPNRLLVLSPPVNSRPHHWTRLQRVWHITRIYR